MSTLDPEGPEGSKGLKVAITVDSYKRTLRYSEYFLARELSLRGHSVTVFTFGPRLRGGRSELDDGFRVVYLPYLFALTNWFWIPTPGAVLTLARCLRSERPDVVHCMPLYSPLSLISAGLAGRGRASVVGAVFTGDLFLRHAYDKVRFNLIRVVVDGWLARRTDAFFALSDFLKGRLAAWFSIPAAAIQVVPLGTDPGEFKPDPALRARARSALGFSKEDVVLVYSGKFIPDKGLDLLLRAAADLGRSRPELKVLLVGAGPRDYERSLRGLCGELGMSGRVVFHRFVPRGELIGLYNASDVAVWPGTHSISMVDAISVGLPLVLTPKFPAAASLIKDGNGLAFQEGSLAGLVTALLTLVDDEELRLEMGRRSRRLAERELGWTALGTRYLEAYEALTRRARGARPAPVSAGVVSSPLVRRGASPARAEL